MRLLLTPLFVVLLAACSPTPPAPLETAPAIAQTIYRIQPTPTPDATATLAKSEWQRTKSGIDVWLGQRTVNAKAERVLIARIDPLRASVRVLYTPDAPKSARDWQDAIHADLVINGGFFDDKNRVTGLLIADGKGFGKSYSGFGGMFSWRRIGPSLQWLHDRPYHADPAIMQAVQGFPMLVVNGARIERIDDNGEPNRRSFVALDRAGRLLFGVTQLAQWTLNDLADFLDQADDLNIVSALNLDGGASSGLCLSGARDDVSMNSFEMVPTVIAVWGKE